MLNLTSIRSGGEEKLNKCKMVIKFNDDLDFANRLLCNCVVQGVSLEYTYSHDCTVIPLRNNGKFWDIDAACSYIAYNFKANLTALEDLAEHIRILVDGVDTVTIYPINEN